MPLNQTSLGTDTRICWRWDFRRYPQIPWLLHCLLPSFLFATIARPEHRGLRWRLAPFLVCFHHMKTGRWWFQNVSCFKYVFFLPRSKLEMIKFYWSIFFRWVQPPTRKPPSQISFAEKNHSWIPIWSVEPGRPLWIVDGIHRISLAIPVEISVWRLKRGWPLNRICNECLGLSPFPVIVANEGL